LEAKTLGATSGYLETKAPVDTLADTCRGGDPHRWQETEEVKAKALVHKQAITIRQLKANTSSNTLGDEEAKRLVDMLAKR